MNAFAANRAYQAMSLEGNVNSASPHKLISMLYEGALVSIASSRADMKAGNIPTRGKMISRAISIINDGLKAGVNMEAGGEIAQNLNALYDYMIYRLAQANANSDVYALDEVEGLLKDLKGAWDSIGTLSVVKSEVVEPSTILRPSVSYGSA